MLPSTRRDSWRPAHPGGRPSAISAAPQARPACRRACPRHLRPGASAAGARRRGAAPGAPSPDARPAAGRARQARRTTLHMHAQAHEPPFPLHEYGSAPRPAPRPAPRRRPGGAGEDGEGANCFCTAWLPRPSPPLPRLHHGGANHLGIMHKPDPAQWSRGPRMPARAWHEKVGSPALLDQVVAGRPASGIRLRYLQQAGPLYSTSGVPSIATSGL